MNCFETALSEFKQTISSMLREMSQYCTDVGESIRTDRVITMREMQTVQLTMREEMRTVMEAERSAIREEFRDEARRAIEAARSEIREEFRDEVRRAIEAARLDIRDEMRQESTKAIEAALLDIRDELETIVDETSGCLGRLNDKIEELKK